jgi:hypothetical protein
MWDFQVHRQVPSHRLKPQVNPSPSDNRMESLGAIMYVDLGEKLWLRLVAEVIFTQLTLITSNENYC